GECEASYVPARLRSRPAYDTPPPDRVRPRRRWATVSTGSRRSVRPHRRDPCRRRARRRVGHADVRGAATGRMAGRPSRTRPMAGTPGGLRALPHPGRAKVHEELIRERVEEEQGQATRVTCPCCVWRPVVRPGESLAGPLE